MKRKEVNRYLVRMVDIPSDLTPSERLILMFLRLHYAVHQKGATREQIMKQTGVAGRTFERSWKTLNARNLLMSERTYSLTTEGQEVANKLAG